ncbi:MAG: alpha/beta hydrolase [Gemmatimonadaceae bacterium]
MDIDRRASPHAHHIRVPRTARFYTLGGGSFTPRDVWFVLHGYGQLAGQFIRYFAGLANDDTLVVAPEAMSRFYLVNPDAKPARERPVGATWMTREDRDSEIADYVEYLDALHDEVASAPVRDGARVNVLGFSQGAATATRWAAHGHADVSRVVLWGGLLPPDTDLSRGQAAVRGARLTLVVGSRDRYIDAAALAAERSRLDAASVSYDVIEFEGGHAINRAVFPRLTGSG